MTDANLLLGYLAARLDPRRAASTLDARGGARRRVGRLGAALGLDELETAEGIVRVANQEMVRALRVVTVERGVDPRRFALMPFGGAGPMHAAALAEELGMERILCPRASGVLSALGLIASERRRDTARTVLLSGDELTAERIAAEVARAARVDRRRHRGRRAPRSTYELRYRGQAFELAIPGPRRPGPGRAGRAVRRASTSAATATATRTRRSSWSTSAWRWSCPAPAREPRGRPRRRSSARRRQARFGGEWLEARVLRGEPAGRACGRGPCVLRAPGGHPGAAPGLAGERRRRTGRSSAAREPMSGSTRSPSRCWSARLRAACEEMGAVLVRAAHSANIKERRDCSTALFDAAGELVMQAEHIPVHLGSMPDAVAAVLDAEQAPGDLWILNDPYRGGTHLPDITLISPIFARRGELLGFAASRAHHADVGGPTPGGHAGRLDPRWRRRAW